MSICIIRSYYPTTEVDPEMLHKVDICSCRKPRIIHGERVIKVSHIRQNKYNSVRNAKP